MPEEQLQDPAVDSLNPPADTTPEPTPSDEPTNVKVEGDDIAEKEVPVNTDKPSLPVFEHRQVLAILDDGKETETHYHCKMEDGTTMHVPKELFV